VYLPPYQTLFSEPEFTSFASPYDSDRYRAKRKREREREEDNDARDRVKEREQIEAERRREEALRREEEEQERRDQEERRRHYERERELERQKEIDRMKEERRQEDGFRYDPFRHPSSEDLPRMDGDKKFGVDLTIKKATPAAAPVTKRADLFSAESDDGETQTKKRTLVPIEYSVEEMMAIGISKEEIEKRQKEEKKKQIQEIIDKIPTDTQQLFAQIIAWTLVDPVCPFLLLLLFFFAVLAIDFIPWPCRLFLKTR